MNIIMYMIHISLCIQLHSLKVMTSRMLLGYLACFKDEHVSIQAEAIALAGTIRLHHAMVLRAIRQLLQDSLCWTIKICALRALAQIGECNKELVEQLMWVVRFEKVSSVRAEACKTIAKLGVGKEKVLQSLKDLVIVDDDPEVVCEARKTLVELGESESVHDEMLQSVCETVKHLGTKEAITNSVRDTDTTRTTNYVLHGRPNKHLSARDYLDHNRRLIY